MVSPIGRRPVGVLQYHRKPTPANPERQRGGYNLTPSLPLGVRPKTGASSMPENVVIIGSGPAAWTAAIYAARANLNPLVFQGNPYDDRNRQNGTLPLGQLALTTE